LEFEENLEGLGFDPDFWNGTPRGSKVVLDVQDMETGRGTFVLPEECNPA